ncbi:MAG: hypothetical protein Q4F31_07355 [Eubacteriales bacterium]|nr:hypothetical protein [Eubacteriales bacterium]
MTDAIKHGNRLILMNRGKPSWISTGKRKAYKKSDVKTVKNREAEILKTKRCT